MRANDTAALVSGHYIGCNRGHKLAECISPNKAKEGFAGGMICSIVSGLRCHDCG